jgi:hypothetical protein
MTPTPTISKLSKKENRKSHGCRPSRMVCLCLTFSATLIACQFGNIFIPEVLLLAATGRGLQEQQSYYALRNFLSEAHKLDAREQSANKEHDESSPRSQQAGQKKETRQQRRKRKKDDKRMERAENESRANSVRTVSTELKEKTMRKRTVKPTMIENAGSTGEEDVVAAISEAITNEEPQHHVHTGADKVFKDECAKPRYPLWEYENYGEHNETKASKRLLIGLYSGFGVYSTLLAKTAHVNRAYARHWNHDVVLVQGAALRVKELDGDCEPPPHRATYDKIPLLQYAIEHKDKYDQLLILDTDALVYEMDFDVTTLLPKARMMAAQKVHPTDNHQTWDVNAGVTLWDLHHPRIQELAKEWLKHSKNGMENNYHPSNDQYHLHYTLKEGNYMDDIFALDEEFNYGHGTIVKHFIRKPQHKQWGEAAILDNRENRIEIAIDHICKEHKQICEAVDKKAYPE